MSDKQLALLRGINVGGRHLIAMPALTALFTDLGCTGVSSYIQSGNVLFTPPAERPGAEGKALAGRIAQALEERFGFPVPVVLRSQGELAQAIAGNPFATAAIDPKLLHVVFLAEPLGARLLALLHGRVDDDERLAACGRELYLHLPDGVGRSKLAMACMAPGQPATNTMRNWQTVLKLAELLGS